MRAPYATTLVLPLLLGLGACFEGPERLDPSTRQQAPPVTARPADHNHPLPAGHPPLAGQLPPGHPPLDSQLPPGHPTLGGAARGMPHGMPNVGHGTNGTATGEVLFAGSVVLAGELGERRQGGVFVIARAPGGGGSLLVRKLEVSEGERGADGARILAFELTDQDSHGVQIPPDVQLEVYYDPDGIVETREGRVTRVFPATRGDLSLRLVLDPTESPSPAGGGY
jgi:hypothetical protein